jgi:hypothetical protein
MLLLEPLEHGEPRRTWHHHVADDEVRRCVNGLGHAGIAIGRAIDMEPAIPENVLKEFPDVWVIIDDEDRASDGHAARLR